jgi:crotonobetainyl-CoA:carnitine CoA-transferase CaiB-like acyl-CoA transferase
MTPLIGTKVVDFSHVIAGPFATFYLSQLGAEVTKVEAPGRGDMMRSLRSGETAFESLNSGKTLTLIDIATPNGRQLALDMAAKADVFVDNYRPGVLERHGLGYSDVRSVNPRIVYCAISGYGHSSEGMSHRGAYDHVIQALTGMAMLAGRDGDPPVKVGFPAVDTMTGILAAFAIVSALYERVRTGRGCMLDISMWGAALQMMYPLVCDTLNHGAKAERLGNQGYSGSPAADIFRCRDGWVSVGANTGRQLGKLTSALGIAPALLNGLIGTRSGDEYSLAKTSNVQHLKDLLSDAMANASAGEIEERLNAVGIPAARVRSVHEFVDEFRQSGLLQPMELGTRPTLTPGLGWRVTTQQELQARE